MSSPILISRCSSVLLFCSIALANDGPLPGSYIKASNTDARDEFGSALDYSNDRLVVGALQEQSGSTGVNGDQLSNDLYASGSVYVYQRTGSTWLQEAYLKASNTGQGDAFGAAVAISGNTIVVGAPGEASTSTGIGGDQSDDTIYCAGAVYVFVHDGVEWTQEAYIKASNPTALDGFGWAVDIIGDTLVVGAPFESSGSAGVNGNQFDDGTHEAGAAYVFVRDKGGWSQEAYIKASNPSVGAGFGGALSMSENTLVVGAYGEGSVSTGINGNQSNNDAPSSGAAYVFSRQGSTWAQEAYLKASNTDMGDGFGTGVDISGDTIVVGAPAERSSATGVNGSEVDNSVQGAGAAYVFVRQGSSWIQQAYLKAPINKTESLFGGNLAIRNDRLLVGAPVEDEGTGAAHLFSRSGTTWTSRARIQGSNTESPDFFGGSLAMEGDQILVGAFGERSDAIGIDGDDSDNSLERSGAVYSFEFDASLSGQGLCAGDGTGTPCPCLAGLLGAGCSNSFTTGAALTALGAPLYALDSFCLEVSGLPPGKFGLCIKGSNSLGQGNVVGDGLLCTNPELRSQLILSDQAGDVLMSEWNGQPFGSFPGVANFGAPTYYQWWYRDPQNNCSGSGFNFSNAWEAIWQ